MRKKRVGCLVVCSIAVVLVAGGAVFVGLCAWYSANYIGVAADYSGSALLATPPASFAEPVTLKLVTYNVQALWVVGRNRAARMRALADKLTEVDPDIAGFQEVFVDEDRQVLIDALAATRLRYYQYYGSGLAGSGLLIMSAYPIKEVYFHRYTVAGAWYKIYEGDWWAGKGVGLARIETPQGFVDFYDTHAQAGYGNPWYDVVRKQQMAELATFINASHTPTVPAFLVGDMNCRPGNEDFETVREGAGLVRVMNVESRIDHIFAIADEAYTFDVVDSLEMYRHNDLRLSDHRGYASTVHVAPAKSPE